MKKILVLTAVLLLCFMLIGCDGATDSDDGKISVVVTAFPHYDFVRQLTKGIDDVEIKMLISPGSEVHTYEPGPSDILAVSACDMFVCTGGESDLWAKNILSSSGNKDVKYISFMDLCADSIKASEAEDREHGHEDGEHGHSSVYDEHVWTSPVAASYLANAVKDALVGIDSENKDAYLANGKEFTEKLSELENAFLEVMNDRVRDEIAVADRFPFYHLAAAYGIKYISAYSGCSTATEPSASAVAALAEKVKNDKLPYVFVIEFSNEKIAKNVISGTDTGILTLHSCHNVSAEDFENGITYIDLMTENAKNLRKALCE